MGNSYPWWKSWNKVLHDPDIMALSCEEYRFRDWNMNIASAKGEDGCIGKEEGIVMLHKHYAPTSLIRKLLKSQCQKGYLIKKGDQYFVKNWERYQAKPSDSTEAQRERKAKQRQKEKPKNAPEQVPPCPA
jgi:hypothetical protein